MFSKKELFNYGLQLLQQVPERSERKELEKKRAKRTLDCETSMKAIVRLRVVRRTIQFFDCIK